MERYVEMKKNKGSGKSIIATARKLSKIIWCMLRAEEEFNPDLMVDKKLLKRAETMRTASKKSA